MNKFWLNMPLFADLSLIAIVFAQYLFSEQFEWLNLPGLLAKSGNQSDLISLTVAFSTVTAMIAGFAGVVIVLGLSSENEKFRAFRVAAGNNLRRNWISIAQNTFSSSFVSIICLLLVILGHSVLSMWFLEIAFVVAFSSTLRLLYLLKALAILVSSEDSKREKEQSATPVSQIIKQKR